MGSATKEDTMTAQLPAITGTSTKQIAYAEDMRTRTLAEIDRIATGKGRSILIRTAAGERVRPSKDPATRAAELDILRAAVLRVTDARTWINRGGQLIGLTAIEWQMYWAGEMEHYWLTRDEVAQIIALRSGQATPTSTATTSAPAPVEEPKTARQVAEMHGVSLSTIYRRIKAGLLTAVKVAGRWQISIPATT